MTFDQMWKWVSPSNSTSEMGHKTCVTRHLCYILYDDLIWPELDLDLYLLSISLLLTWHLCHPFSRIFAEFALAAVSGLVCAADKAKSQLLHLAWPWPNILPCLINFKIALESSRWELSIAASRFSLRLLVRRLDRGWYTPPSPANGSWL